MSKTANLQSGLSVKQAAKMMNVSERSVYMARKIQRLRPDLMPAIDAGELTLNAAMKLIEGKSRSTPYERFVKAWNKAARAYSELSEDERSRFRRDLNEGE